MTPQTDSPPPAAIEEGGTRPLLLDDRAHDGPRWLRRPLAGAAGLVAAWLAYLLFTLPKRSPLLPELVTRRLAESGVSNPATAVLLNFRAYDTLLELTVLVAAVLAVWSLDRGTQPLAQDRRDRAPDPVLHELARLIVPLSGVVAVYLTWVGVHGAGGGFQAGALMAGAGILLVVGGIVPPFSAGSAVVRIGVALGILAFLAVGLGAMAWTGVFLEYPEGWAPGLVAAIEGVIAISVTLVLVEFFVDVPAVPASDPSLERVHATGDPLGRMLSRGSALGTEE